MSDNKTPRCARCGRPIKFIRDEVGIHPKHVFLFAFHFAVPNADEPTSIFYFPTGGAR